MRVKVRLWYEQPRDVEHDSLASIVGRDVELEEVIEDSNQLIFCATMTPKLREWIDGWMISTLADFLPKYRGGVSVERINDKPEDPNGVRPPKNVSSGADVSGVREASQVVQRRGNLNIDFF